jgi:hypothetical protein
MARQHPSEPHGPRNLIGLNGRLFAERQPGPDESAFQIDNTSAQYFQSPYYLHHKDQVLPVPHPLLSPPRLDFSLIVGSGATTAIQHNQTITFHAVGDTGAAKAKTGPATEAAVADMMVADVQAGGPDAPAFFFHLGDVVYYFGEGQYYYDQFYEPFRAYDRPIFAIPGNHDGITFGPNAGVPQVPTLQAFLRNFCATRPGQSPDAGGLVRSVMTQPGVYFTLDAPLVSIIGLYSNVLEGPGVISSQHGTYPIGDDQLTFLQNELARLKPSRTANERAVILAVHHPPLSADRKHRGSTGLAGDIDSCCHAAGLWPDAVLSGHAHLYQRFTRVVAGSGHQIPYIVAGSGGFAATPPIERIPAAPFTIGDYTLELNPIIEFGYLTVTVDMTRNAKQLIIAFHSPKLGKNVDRVIVDLTTNRLVGAGGTGGTQRRPGPRPGGLPAHPARRRAPGPEARSPRG